VEFDQDRNLVIARGAVEAWQGGRILRTDTFTYNRETGIATAEGNVQLLEPDGQVSYADRAELTGDMRNGVVEGLKARLAQNGRMVAMGGRRTDGTITDMARVVYSSCDLCADDPEAPPLWQLRARVATHDRNEQRIRYRDAALQMGGWPVLYTPYLSHPDPSIPRASGFLTPVFGTSRFLGPFVTTPYYWAIDGQQDLTLSPTISANQDPAAGIAYRRRFNSGTINLSGSVGNLGGGTIPEDERGWGGHVYGRAQFSLDENRRTGINVNRATSQTYLRAFRYPSPRQLTSDVYLEGFWGTEGYARIDSRIYQSLNEEDNTSVIPLVLPSIQADYAFPRDAWGGYLTVDTNNYVLLRSEGTDTRRIASRINYDLPTQDRFGGIWTVRGQADLVGRSADNLQLGPVNSTTESSLTEANANARVALDWRMPFARSAGEYGSQIIEPRVQFVTGPSTGRQYNIPNEDSLDFEFTDANLFALNRFTGRDRQEGGTRVDAALRGAWLFPNGGQVEALGGRSFRASEEDVFYAGSGLEDQASDWVGRVRVSPVSWLDLIARARFDGETMASRLTETSARVGLGPVSVSAGYLFTTPNPALTNTPNTDRREVSGGVSARIGQYWRVGAAGRYDVQNSKPVSAGLNLVYEDECLVFSTSYNRSWAENTNRESYYPSGETLLFSIGFKTIGDFGFRAI
jgi:LPS-assembly protein